MARRFDRCVVADLEELTPADAYDGILIPTVLERRRIITKVEILDDDKRLRQKGAEAH